MITRFLLNIRGYKKIQVEKKMLSSIAGVVSGIYKQELYFNGKDFQIISRTKFYVLIIQLLALPFVVMVQAIREYFIGLKTFMEESIIGIHVEIVNYKNEEYDALINSIGE